MTRLVLISGISGSGKSVALRALEDSGYYCVDNLPVPFLNELVASLRDQGQTKIAISIDARTGNLVSELPARLSALRAADVDVMPIFLDADDATLAARYQETRRRHPLHNYVVNQRAGTDVAQTHDTLAECIAQERDMLSPVREISHVIDTSEIKAALLRQWIFELIKAQPGALVLLFESFAFKNGVPSDADLVYDVRCLPNPHYDPKLRPLTGRDEPVAAFLQPLDMVQDMLRDIESFVRKWLPRYAQDTRSYLTVAIGCTGGQHRSVYCVEQLAQRFRSSEHVIVRHRALNL